MTTVVITQRRVAKSAKITLFRSIITIYQHFHFLTEVPIQSHQFIKFIEVKDGCHANVCNEKCWVSAHPTLVHVTYCGTPDTIYNTEKKLNQKSF